MRDALELTIDHGAQPGRLVIGFPHRSLSTLLCSLAVPHDEKLKGE